ncbi:glycine zipper 2TM domain-containing protein [Arenimonas composti]|uniref:Glycine zipper 2TM domain-containing protein n=1 Tax=Arenimonas composti TR7-09 = DSM 18010 TaxID=1121013 RepID=A0A091BJN8_9GAMM|nr:glycine zipper 2TM domain-containing protein [Arenimonas composti]KFN51004.1 hypothetical protein P873_04725 [Arenimonas composti TR7-09 = DSM 18010]
MKRSMLAPLVLALTAVSTAQAQSYDDRGYYDRDGYGSAAIQDVARVTRVEPMVERVQQPVDRQECWYEEEPAYAYEDDRRGVPRTSGGGAVLGAIVGGALGNTVGRGDGRRAATIAGAVIGGTIGNNVERENIRRQDEYYGRDDAPVATTEVRRCRVVTDYQPDERVVGYRVEYEYAGRRFETVTDRHPGSQLRVRVEVIPED